MNLPKYFYYLLIILFLLIVPFFKTINAAELFSVRSSIRLSVCGDLVAEFPEQCDNLDLKHQTCQSLGLTGGDLSCDIACDYLTSQCIGTPTPTLTPTPTPVPVSTTVSTSDSTAGPAAAGVSPTATPLPSPFPLLPPSLAAYDIDGDGHLHGDQLALHVKKWFDNWTLFHQAPKNSAVVGLCDINRDQICNITDLSVLLYYINR